MMHLHCLLNNKRGPVLKRCPACRQQIPAWVIGTWQEHATEQGIFSGVTSTTSRQTVMKKKEHQKAAR